MKPALMLFTRSYPYDVEAEQTFLDPEIKHLARVFGEVVLVPAVRRGSKSVLPEGVTVDESLADCGHEPGSGSRPALTALHSMLLLRELATGHLPVWSATAARRLLAFITQARRVASWLRTTLASRRHPGRPLLLYTYWLDHTTAGLMLARDPARCRLVSRVHGYDLYEERQRPPYLPCRPTLLRALDCLYTVSEHGRSYLRNRYPKVQARIRVSRLGTSAPGFSAVPSSDGVLRVVSCSAVVPVKRVSALAEGLARAARDRPGASLEWRHFGDGPLRQDLLSIAAGVAPANLRCLFPGQVPNDEVLRHYRERPVDLFANVSESEGIPVAIMEAQSCGVPAMASAVGGVTEIVTKENGFLLPPSPSAEAVGRMLTDLLDTPGALRSRRLLSAATWTRLSDADQNFSLFSQELRHLCEQLPDTAG